MSNATNKTATQIRMEQAAMEQRIAQLAHATLGSDVWTSQMVSIYKDQVKMATMTGNSALRAAHMLKVLIPIDTIWENVYRIDTSVKYDTDKYILKLTFYNDESVKLEFHWKMIGDEQIMVPQPPDDDFEAWKAEAIMKCDAGRDFYERPKPQAPNLGGVSSALSQAQMGQNALYQQRLNSIAQQSSMPLSGQGIAQSPLGQSQNSGWLGMFGNIFK